MTLTMNVRKHLIFMLLSVGLAACLPPASHPSEAPIATAVVTPSRRAFETGQAITTVEPENLPATAENNLGELRKWISDLEIVR